MRTKPHRQRGLSILDVCIVVATIALVGLIVLPMLARTHRCGPRTYCINNLKQVGLSYRLWANDHEDRFPFASTNADSSLAWVNSPQVFRHYQVLSNELVTPKVLVCRADAQRIRTNDFVNLSNTNVSYFVGLDAREDQPQSILSGDWNITGGTLSKGFLRLLASNSVAGWGSNMHQRAGNLGLGDGSVQQVTELGLRKQVQAQPLPVIRLAIP